MIRHGWQPRIKTGLSSYCTHTSFNFDLDECQFYPKIGSQTRRLLELHALLESSDANSNLPGCRFWMLGGGALAKFGFKVSEVLKQIWSKTVTAQQQPKRRSVTWLRMTTLVRGSTLQRWWSKRTQAYRQLFARSFDCRSCANYPIHPDAGRLAGPWAQWHEEVWPPVICSLSKFDAIDWIQIPISCMQIIQTVCIYKVTKVNLWMKVGDSKWNLAKLIWHRSDWVHSRTYKSSDLAYLTLWSLTFWISRFPNFNCQEFKCILKECPMNHPKSCATCVYWHVSQRSQKSV